jgi:hypothetical protein
MNLSLQTGKKGTYSSMHTLNKDATFFFVCACVGGGGGDENKSRTRNCSASTS